ncbi:MAG: hypothetical protein CMH53_05570, partial [Myxococcales bacterium]|nr:hypothetical protein [Myxococcales bacterium]
MSLLSPWMLIVALTMVVPPLLHLIGARRARRVQFSALQFLLTKDPKRARNIRIEHWLLVLTRMAILAMLALGLSEPMTHWFNEPSSLQASEEPSILVVVVDDSLSMSTQTKDGNNRFSQAQHAASQLIASMPAGSRVAVVMSGRPARSLQLRPTGDLAKVLVDLNAQTVRGVDDDAIKALALAERLGSATSALPSRIVVFSDLQRSGWLDATKGRDLVQWQSIGSRSEDIEMLEVSATPAPELGRNKTRIHAQIKRHGVSPWTGDITLSYGDKEMRSKLTVQAGEVAEHDFIVTANTGVASVSLKSQVGAQLNDIRDVLIGDSETVRVLLINGDPRPVLRDDEAFFVRKALAASAIRPGEMSVTVQSVG